MMMEQYPQNRQYQQQPQPQQRRRSSIFPQYLRRKSQSTNQFLNNNRKDSIFNSESTTNLYPLSIEEKIPGLNDSNDSSINLNDELKALKFGWINGVYIRTVLNIFGVMLFLRMGWITGNIGIIQALATVLISTILTFCTTLSMSAICTNGEIGTGGIYYMISRSLGAEAGSMIGIIFSFANAVLVSLNLVGAAETTVEIVAIFREGGLVDPDNDARIYATILLIIVAIIPLIGMEWEAKAMFVLLIILMVALINYCIGTFLTPTKLQISQGMTGWKYDTIMLNLWGPEKKEESLSQVFAVFFPSVIGIFAGASMSGDLRDPNAAIPKGTFLAILTTSSVYAILVIFLGFTILPYASGNYEEMKNFTDLNHLQCYIDDTCKFGLIKDYQTMTLSSVYGPLIYAGIFAATVSSALGSYVCAPRIFQALCEDKLFPYINYFAKGYGKINDPRRGYLLTFLISLIFIMIGNVNDIAPIISNFFMASFFLVNVTCFHASLVASPSFRPTFKYYNKWISLLIGIACVVIMFFLHYPSAIVTIVVMGLIYFYISKKGPEVNWGTSTRGQVYNNAIFAALRLNQSKDHVKNFRPSILLLTGNPTARIPLVEFANKITINRSLLIIGHIINYELIDPKLRSKVIDLQYEWFNKRKIKAFYLLMESNSIRNGTKTILQCCGLGKKLSPNILMMGYKSSWHDCIPEDLIDYYNTIVSTYEMLYGIIILRIQEGLDYADYFDTTQQQQQQQQNPNAFDSRSNSLANESTWPQQPTITQTSLNSNNNNFLRKQLSQIMETEMNTDELNNHHHHHHDSINEDDEEQKQNGKTLTESIQNGPGAGGGGYYHQNISTMVHFDDSSSTPSLTDATTMANTQLNSRNGRKSSVGLPTTTTGTGTGASFQRNHFKKNVENMKSLIPIDAIEAINQFSHKQPNGPIDVWWLAKDGGLIVLIPYLLRMHSDWNHCPLRVFCLVENAEDSDSIRDKMTELLARLRIPYQSLNVIVESDLKISEKSKERFRSFIEKFLNEPPTTATNPVPNMKNPSSSATPTKITKAYLAKYKEQTNKYLKLRDQMLSHSKLSTLVVMTLPKPRNDILAPLYMSWLETISEEMPPFLFIGAHKDAVSIAC